MTEMPLITPTNFDEAILFIIWAKLLYYATEEVAMVSTSWGFEITSIIPHGWHPISIKYYANLIFKGSGNCLFWDNWRNFWDNTIQIITNDIHTKPTTWDYHLTRSVNDQMILYLVQGPMKKRTSIRIHIKYYHLKVISVINWKNHITK